MVKAGLGNIAAALLAWYDRHRRRLPWRALPGETADPYRVWLSEIMLQQTSVVSAGPYFQAFTERWPTVRDLAAADLDDVLRAWAGLGYYARARNLHKCAREVVARFGGGFPADEEKLLELPGIGAYTAAAILAIAFDRQATAMDGNIERVVARLFDVAEPLPGVKPKLKALAATLVPPSAPRGRPGDYTQAMMDLGSAICVPRAPKCVLCPLSAACRARASGAAPDLPARAAKTEKPTRRGIAFWLANPAGAVLLRRRPEQGLLGGMMEVPSSDWQAGPLERAQALRAAPADLPWQEVAGTVRHTFTHFHLELGVVRAELARGWQCLDGVWVPLDRLGGEALPTVMRKVVRQVLMDTAS